MTEVLETVWQIAKSPFVDKSKKKKLKIRFSLFFDGTNNNAINIKEREKFEANRKSESNSYLDYGVLPSSSYDNGLTNIALMEPHVITESSDYDFVFKVYVEGQGTFNLKDNSNFFGKGMGTFDSGVYRRARLGLARALEKLDEFFSENKPDDYVIEKIDIDVFGFSRGAATARHCIHVIGGQDLSDMLTNISVPAFYKRIFMRGFIDITEEQVKVKFAGLYDTVVSVNASQLAHRVLMGNIRNQRAVAKAEKSLHLAAAEEHRKDFPLHTIKSAIDAGTGEEYYLPGVHSDVGGSYNLANSILLDDKQKDVTIRHVIKAGSYNEVADEYNKLMSTNRYTNDTLKMEITKWGTGRGGSGPRKAILVATRKIDGLEYARATNEVNLIINQGKIKDLLKDMDNLTNAGWYHPPKKPVLDPHKGDDIEHITDEIVIVTTDWVGGGRGAPNVKTPYKGYLVVNRLGIKSAYNCIPLKIMAKYAEKEGIKMNKKLQDRANETLKDEPELIQLEGMINDYIAKNGGKTSKPEHWLNISNEFMKKIRHDHLHMSSRLEKTLGMSIDPGFTPRIEEKNGYKRRRYYYEG